MAKKSMILKQQAPAKFSTRKYNRCKICGRPHAYLRNYGICRICFRKILQGHAAPQAARHRPAAFFFLSDLNPLGWASNRGKRKQDDAFCIVLF